MRGDGHHDQAWASMVTLTQPVREVQRRAGCSSRPVLTRGGGSLISLSVGTTTATCSKRINPARRIRSHRVRSPAGVPAGDASTMKPTSNPRRFRVQESKVGGAGLLVRRVSLRAHVKGFWHHRETGLRHTAFLLSTTHRRWAIRRTTTSRSLRLFRGGRPRRVAFSSQRSLPTGSRSCWR